MAYDPRLAGIVWAETAGLQPANGQAEVLARLHAVVATLASRAIAAGTASRFRNPVALPVVGSPQAQMATAMTRNIDAALNNNPGDLPNRAVLWQITGNGQPRLDVATLPDSAQWITVDQTATSDFNDARGHAYRLYESNIQPAAGAPIYISSLTGTGTPSLPAPAHKKHWYENANWWIGLGGAALFFLAAFNILWAASSFVQAQKLLTNGQPAYIPEFANSLDLLSCPNNTSDTDAAFCWTSAESLKSGDGTEKQGAALDAAKQAQKAKRDTVATTIGPGCVDWLTAWATQEENGRKKTPSQTIVRKADEAAKDLNCLYIMGQATDFAARRLVLEASRIPGWPLVQNTFWFLFHWQLPGSGLQNVSLGTSATAMILGVILVLVGLGRGVTGSPLGVLISPQGRYSLALAQVTFWTVLILTTVVAIAIFNVGLVAEQMRYFLPLPSGATGPIAAVNGFFPDIPEGIWATLGITLSSTVLSSWIKKLKGTVPEDGTASLGVAGAVPDDSEIGFFKAPVVAYSDDHPPSVADWFLGEEQDNKDSIDISRVQMVLVTAGLLVTYGHAMFASIRDLTVQEILLTIQNTGVLIPALPVVGASMAIMLAVSHGTYLVSKAAGKQNSSGQ
jgi:hypothetical protein